MYILCCNSLGRIYLVFLHKILQCVAILESIFNTIDKQCHAIIPTHMQSPCGKGFWNVIYDFIFRRECGWVYKACSTQERIRFLFSQYERFKLVILGHNVLPQLKDKNGKNQIHLMPTSKSTLILLRHVQIYVST